jgi:Tfp pilus assembly protein PilX
MADNFFAIQKEAIPCLSERRYEQGVVLVFSLFILLILAAIGLAASSTSVFQQRMSSNLLDQDVAFQASESGLRAGETIVEALPSLDRGVAACDASSAPCVSTINSVNGGIFFQCRHAAMGRYLYLCHGRVCRPQDHSGVCY